MQKNDNPRRILQFKVVLKHIKPAIWRRVEVSDGITLRTFAVSLILAIGWKNSHLHEFILGRSHYGPIIDENENAMNLITVEDETEHFLREFLGLPMLDKFTFLYDFGDGWEHEVRFEGVIAPEPGAFYPRCTGGKRNCPPEDCGGIGGYDDLVEKLKNSVDEEYEGLLEWLGGKYEPEFFDLDIINATLRKTDAYEKYGFEDNESAGEDIGDDYKNCGIGTAEDKKAKSGKKTGVKKARKTDKKQKAEFSDPMQKFYDMSDEDWKRVLNNVYCGKCAGLTLVKDHTYHTEGKSVIIRGVCAKCGHKVARVLEGE